MGGWPKAGWWVRGWGGAVAPDGDRVSVWADEQAPATVSCDGGTTMGMRLTPPKRTPNVLKMVLFKKNFN